MSKVLSISLAVLLFGGTAAAKRIVGSARAEQIRS